MPTRQTRSLLPTRQVLIKDDRDRSFPLLDRDTSGAELPSEANLAVEHAVAERMYSARPKDPVQRSWSLFCLIVFFVDRGVSAGLRSAGVSKFAAELAPVPLLMAFMVLWRRATRAHLAEPIRHALLARQLCASCAYSLAGLGDDPD